MFSFANNLFYRCVKLEKQAVLWCDKNMNTGACRGKQEGQLLEGGGSIGVYARSGGLAKLESNELLGLNATSPNFWPLER